MADFEAMVNAHLGASTRKAKYLEQKAKEKQDYLDPVFEFGVDDVRFLDQDTVELPTGERLRLSGGDGRTFDSYEADSPEVGVSGAQKYAERPETFEAHRRNYARAFGLDPDDVTVEDLVIAGNSQKAKAQERFRQMADEKGRIRYRQRGTDDYGRIIAELDPEQVNLSGRTDNAAYYSRYNYNQTLADAISGAEGDFEQGRNGRSFLQGASDQVVNFTAGAGRMANDLVQGAGALLGVNNIPGVDEGHHAIREGLEAFKNWGVSEDQKRRERLAAERSELQSEYYNVQRDKYLKKGNSELTASVRAGFDEMTNAIGNIIEDPATLLDKTVESLPYMIGVAATGRAATNAAIKKIHNQVLLRQGVQKNITKGLEKTRGRAGTKGKFETKEALEDQKTFHVNQFLASPAGQKYLKKVQTVSGVSTVGLTEGLSTSAEVYDSIVQMSEADAMNSDKYLELRGRGLTHEKALEELAEDASFNTFLAVTAAAGAASYVTGAGAFEASLFKGLAGVRKSKGPIPVQKGLQGKAGERQAAKVAKAEEAVAKQKAKQNKWVRRGKSFVAGAAAPVKFLGPASVKEGAEEFLQSGGGELFSQLAKAGITGEQVGPGVGKAAGEGAAVGFASGGIAQTVFGGLGKLAKAGADPRKIAQGMNQLKDKAPKLFKEPEVRKATREHHKNAAAGGLKNLGGGVPDVIEERDKVEADVSGTFDSAIKEYQVEYDKDPTAVDHILHYERLKAIRERALATGQDLTEEQQLGFEIVQNHMLQQGKDIADVITSLPAKKRGNTELQILAKLQFHGVEVDTTNLTEDEIRVLDQEAQLAEDFQAAEDIAAEIEAEVGPEQASEVRRVHDEKFGDVKFERKGKGGQTNTFYGLGYYKRRMLELMATLDPANKGKEENSELDYLARRLRSFAKSQNAYLQTVLDVVAGGPGTKLTVPGTVRADGTGGTVIEWTDPGKDRGGIVALANILLEEDARMQSIIAELQTRWKEWGRAGKKKGKITSAAQSRAAQEELNKAEQQLRKNTGKRRISLSAKQRKALANITAERRRLADTLKAGKVKVGKGKPSATAQKRKELVNQVKLLTNKVNGLKEQFEQLKPRYAKGIENLKNPEVTQEYRDKVAWWEDQLERFPDTIAKAEEELAEAQAELDALPEEEEQAETERDLTEDERTRIKNRINQLQKMDENIRDSAAFQNDAAARAAYNAQRTAGSVANPELRADFEQTKEIKDLTDKGQSLVRLIRQARDAKDFELMQEIIAYNRQFNARKTALRRGKSESDASTETEDDTQFSEDPNFRREGWTRPGVLGIDDEAVDANEEAPQITSNRVSSRPSVTPAEEGETETQTTTEAPKSPLLAAFKQGAAATLKVIAEQGTHPGRAALAARLLQLLNGRDFKVNPLNKREWAQKFGKKREKTFGAFNDGQIWLNMDRLRTNKTDPERVVNTFMHELMHGILDKYTAKDMSPELRQRLLTLRTQAQFALLRRGHAIDRRLAKIIMDEKEFLTHAWNTPYFQDFLKQTKAAEGSETLWDKLVNWVTDLLQAYGVGTKTAMAEVIDITDAMFAEIEALQGKKLTKEDNLANVIEDMLDDAVEQIDKATEPGADTASAVEAEGEVRTIPGRNVKELVDDEVEAIKEQRLAEATRYQTLLDAKRVDVDEVYLSNDEDRALFENLVNNNIPPIQALEQVKHAVEPNPRNRLQRENPPVVDDATIEAAAVNAATLNAPTGTKAVAARNPLARLWNWLVGETEARVKEIKRQFGKIKQGTKASDMWVRKRKTVRDLLASEDRLMDILTDPASRDKFYDKVGLTSAEERAMNTFALFYQNFVRTLDRSLPEESNAIASKKNDAAISPHYYFRDANGHMDANVVGAMALESLQYLIGSGTQTLWNSDDDIRSILGIAPNEFVDPEAKKVFGQGTLLTNAINEVARGIDQHLNLRLKDDAKPLIHERLIASLAAQSFVVMAQMQAKGVNPVTGEKVTVPLIKLDKIGSNEWVRLQNMHAGAAAAADLNTLSIYSRAASNKDIIMVRNNSMEFQYPNGDTVFQDASLALRQRIEKGRNVFTKLFGSRGTRSPLFHVPSMRDIPERVHRTYMKIPEEMRERLLHDAQNGYSMDMDVFDLLDKFENPEDFLEMAHELIPPGEVLTFHKELQPGADGRNRAIKNDLAEMMRWGRQYRDTKFYLPSKMTKNGRAMIDSNVINPQSSKLHRFAFVRDEWARKITKGKLKEDEIRGLSMAIGLGMGLKTDSLFADDIVDLVNTAFTTDSRWKRAMDVIVARKEDGGKFTEADMKILAEVLKEEGTHTLAALNAAAIYFTAPEGAEVEIKLPHETDGVTNGYIIGLLATPPAGPITASYKALLNAGGIYFKGDPWNNLAEYKAAGNLDNYQQVAQGTRQNLEQIRETSNQYTTEDYAQWRKLDIHERKLLLPYLLNKGTMQDRILLSGLVPSSAQLNQLDFDSDPKERKKGRDFAKDPLMVMSYGAGSASVRRQVTRAALENFYKELAKAGFPEDGSAPTLESITAVMNKAYGIINGTIMATRILNIRREQFNEETQQNEYMLIPLEQTRSKNGFLTQDDVAYLVNKHFNNDLQDFATGFRLKGNALNMFNEGISLTMAQALDDSLQAKLSPVREVRAQINAGMNAVNHMFVLEFQNRVAALGRENGVVTNQDKRDIKQALVDEGLTPSIASALSEGILDQLEMTDTTPEYLETSPNNLLGGVGQAASVFQLIDREIGLLGAERQAEKTRTLTGRLVVQTPSKNIGVASVVKSIHGLDGVINSLLWGLHNLPVTNIHDAQLSPWWAAEGIAREANTGFVETIAGYDLPAEFLKSIERLAVPLWDDTKRLSVEQRDEVAVTLAETQHQHNFMGTNWRYPDHMKNAPMKDKGRFLLQELRRVLPETALNSNRAKANMFGDIRWVNQFAQDGTEISTPNGIDLKNPDRNTFRSFEAKQDPTQTVKEEDVLDTTQFAEDFESLEEYEKVEHAWEAMKQYEQEEVPHEAHLDHVLRNFIVPGLRSIGAVLNHVIEQDSTSDVHEALWEGDRFRTIQGAHTLSGVGNYSMQERAAQEYLTAILRPALSGGEGFTDPFLRKEARRLFNLAKSALPRDVFLPPADELTGDPAIAQALAEEKYQYVFENGAEYDLYERFLSVGLTDRHMLNALNSIENADPAPRNIIDWDKGIIRSMLSLVRRVVEALGGVSQRFEGGTVSDAMQAAAATAIAVNQRNAQRIVDFRNNKDERSRVNKLNAAIVSALDEKVVSPLTRALNASEQRRLDPENPTAVGFFKSITYSAIHARDAEVRQAYDEFYRSIATPQGFGKDNWVFDTINEIMPWQSQNTELNQATQTSWLGLLRKSKYIVDMARQEMLDHTRTYLNKSFDPQRHQTMAQKVALTNVVLKTDLSALLDRNDNGYDMGQLSQLITDRDYRRQEIARYEVLLAAATNSAKLRGFNVLFQNQAYSLANLMVTGKALIENQMMNAHNIVSQIMLRKQDQVEINEQEYAELLPLVDRLTSLYALDRTPINDIRLAQQTIDHEMGRVEAIGDNGFTRLVGMHTNFKLAAEARLFRGNKTQMQKGYVYEMFDREVNVEYALRGSQREQELIADGMQLVTVLEQDPLDRFKEPRVLYKGMRGLSTYNKSITSLTDLQHRGANLFTTNGYISRDAKENLSHTRNWAYSLVKDKQFKPGYRNNNNVNMIPIVNENGNIVDYRYVMSEQNKRDLLKMQDPFDRILPRMFAAIGDRINSQEINRNVIDLLYAEWQQGGNDPDKRFVSIHKNATSQEARDMWNLFPEDMQRYAKSKFGSNGVHVRDDVANLVFGFRKATISNIKKPDSAGGGTIWGKNTPLVRMAEKVWLEIISLMRIKIAILTPAVVIGNMASNLAMLLMDGIPLNYIRKTTTEAITSMRQYQKDRQALTELEHHIGQAEAQGKNTRALVARAAQLTQDLQNNPVANLVADGLFTSITADLGVDDDTIRGSLIQKAEDFVGDKGGKAGRAAKHVVKELYMLPGSKGYKAAVAATQYADFVGRYVKFKYDTQVNKKDREQAINEALAAFIYYDIPQPKYLQAANDMGLIMFSKFFLRIQHIVARMYSQNPVAAFSTLGLQKALLPSPLNENIMNYGLGDGLMNKFNNPIGLPGKIADTLNPAEPALTAWLFPWMN